MMPSASRLPDELRKIASIDDPTKESGSRPLRELWRALDPHYLDREPASVCVLFRGSSLAEAEVLLTLRSGVVATHANQVAFPGGSWDAEDERDATRAAIRECIEEVGIPPGSIAPQGVLESYPTFGGHFLVYPVLACLDPCDGDPPLRPAPGEVVLAEWVPVARLMQSRQVEVRSVLGQNIQAPYFMWGDRKMWGLSAWIFDSILNRYATISL